MSPAEIIAEAVARQIVDALTYPDQGGHPDYLGDGRWTNDGATVTVRLSEEEVNAAFLLLGETPTQIVPLGTCETCRFADRTRATVRDRGWGSPCVRCVRPVMSKFEPLPVAAEAPR